MKHRANKSPIRGRILAVTAAGLLALGFSGVFAASMSVAASGHVGAGAVPVQSSCLTGTVSIVPLQATRYWDTGENFWVYPDLVLSGDFRGCRAGDQVLVSVFVPGNAPTTVAAPYTLKTGDLVAGASLTIPLATASSGKPYLPATTATDSSYALLVHS